MNTVPGRHVTQRVRTRSIRFRPAALMGSVLPAAWSFMLAARSRGLAACWTNLHMLPGDAKDASQLLGLTPEMTQVSLIPRAYAVGRDFKPAYRRPLAEIVHHDRSDRTRGGRQITPICVFSDTSPGCPPRRSAIVMRARARGRPPVRVSVTGIYCM